MTTADGPPDFIPDDEPYTFVGSDGQQYTADFEGNFTDASGNSIPHEQGVELLRSADLDDR
jgi:hypothetical protein